MKTSDVALGLGAVVLGALVVLYLQYRQQQTPAPETPSVAESPAPVAQAPRPPAVRYPVTPAPEAAQPAVEPPVREPPSEPASERAKAVHAPPVEQEQAQPLPALDTSDRPLRHDLTTVISAQALDLLFHSDALIRRLVVSVDNLPGRQFPRSNYRVARSIPGLLAVRREGEGDAQRLYLSADNYARYTPFVNVVERLDIDRLVAIYRHYYPLFQQAYENLGYPDSAYFNDRLVDVIDHLLDTPDVAGPIRLLQPHVLYLYADPELEALSAGQKVLIRVGPVNAHKLKDKLRVLRNALVGLGAND